MCFWKYGTKAFRWAMGRPSRIKIVRLAATWNFFSEWTWKIAKNPSPRYFLMGKFFQERTMRKLRSRGFRKCGTFGSCELFNGSCSKSTDFEISGPSPKIRGVKKKELPQFWVFGSETNSRCSPPYELPWLFVSGPKNQNCGSSFFLTPPPTHFFLEIWSDFDSQ